MNVDPAGPAGPVHVVVVGAVAPTRASLEAHLHALAAAGATVDLLLLNLPADADVLAGLPVTRRRLVLTRWSVAPPPDRWSLRGLADTVTYRLLRPANRRASPRTRLARALRRDPVARAAVQRADVLVALDRHAVLPVRQACRRSRPAFYGLAAAVRLVTGRSAAGLPVAGPSAAGLPSR